MNDKTIKVNHSEDDSDLKEKKNLKNKQILDDDYLKNKNNIENNTDILDKNNLENKNDIDNKEDKHYEKDKNDSLIEENLENKTDLENDNKQLIDLNKILSDMLKDLLNTFPELLESLTDDLKDIYLNNDKELIKTKNISNYLKKVFPEKFFDILYQNNELFKTKIELLPGIDFHILWNENITDLTRETLWKYLQLLLFNIVPLLSGDSFGDTSKLFEAINEDVFKEKLEETINGMQNMFNMENTNQENENENSKSDTEEFKEGLDDMFKNFMPNMDKNFNAEDIPDAQSIHDHVNNMMGGKLGTLAKDIAEETAKDMNIEMDDASSINDVFHKLFKNPTKLMDLIKNVGSKLDEKLKSGDIKESELLEEANEFVNKMKNMPGMKNMQNLFNQMGMGNMGGKNGKMNFAAMQSHIQNKMGSAKRLDRMREKLAKKKEDSNKFNGSLELKDINNGVENLVYSTGESYEKSLKTNLKAKNNFNENKSNSNAGKKKKKRKGKMKLKYL